MIRIPAAITGIHTYIPPVETIALRNFTAEETSYGVFIKNSFGAIVAVVTENKETGEFRITGDAYSLSPMNRTVANRFQLESALAEIIAAQSTAGYMDASL